MTSPTPVVRCSIRNARRVACRSVTGHGWAPARRFSMAYASALTPSSGRELSCERTCLTMPLLWACPHGSWGHEDDPIEAERAAGLRPSRLGRLSHARCQTALCVDDSALRFHQVQCVSHEPAQEGRV